MLALSRLSMAVVRTTWPALPLFSLLVMLSRWRADRVCRRVMVIAPALPAADGARRNRPIVQGQRVRIYCHLARVRSEGLTRDATPAEIMPSRLRP